MDDFVEELLKRHNYIINLSSENNTITVDYSGKLKTQYIWCDGGLVKNQKDSIPLNNRLVRLYLLFDIYRECKKLGLPKDIIRTPENKPLTELIPLTLDEEDGKNETKLHEMTFELLKDNKNFNRFDDDAEELGILPDLNILKGLIV